MPGKPKRILILGGTSDARELASRLNADEEFFPVTSLAGLTSTPEPLDGETRSGGFGGVAGLHRFIEDHAIAAVVDASHPFAAQISANAATACEETEVPCLRLERPAWEAQEGDDWTIVPDVRAAAFTIPPEARAFVTVGRQEIGHFFSRDDIFVLARMIERPDIDVPAWAELMLARPPFTLQQEKTLMVARDIGVLVTKNSGGDATYAKVAAARELGLPVIMVARPVKAGVASARDVDGLIALLEEGTA